MEFEPAGVDTSVFQRMFLMELRGGCRGQRFEKYISDGIFYDSIKKYLNHLIALSFFKYTSNLTKKIFRFWSNSRDESNQINIFKKTIYFF